MIKQGLIDFWEKELVGLVPEREARLLTTACRKVMGIYGWDTVRLEERLHPEDTLEEFERRRDHLAVSTRAAYRSRFLKVVALYEKYLAQNGMPVNLERRELEFPLRSGVVVGLNLPADMTKREAVRLAQFIGALGL